MLKISSPKITLAVLGGGSWATALVKIFTDSKIHVNWYVPNPEDAQKIIATSKNPNYLTEIKFKPSRISVSSDINEVVSKSEWIVFAIPSAYLESELKKIPQVCGSLREAMESLDKDRAFLTKGGVFTDDQIDGYISLKFEEIYKLEHTPHPIEFEMYYSQ